MRVRLRSTYTKLFSRRGCYPDLINRTKRTYVPWLRTFRPQPCTLSRLRARQSSCCTGRTPDLPLATHHNVFVRPPAMRDAENYSTPLAQTTENCCFYTFNAPSRCEPRECTGRSSLISVHRPRLIFSSLTVYEMSLSLFTFCRAMLCKRGLCRHGVCVCLPVRRCVSVTFVDCVKTNKHIFHFFHHRVATPF